MGIMSGLFAPRGDEHALEAPALGRIRTEIAVVDGLNPPPVMVSVLNGAASVLSREVIVIGCALAGHPG